MEQTIKIPFYDYTGHICHVKSNAQNTFLNYTILFKVIHLNFSFCSCPSLVHRNKELSKLLHSVDTLLMLNFPYMVKLEKAN